MLFRREFLGDELWSRSLVAHDVGEAQQGHQKQKVSQGEGCDLAVVLGLPGDLRSGLACSVSASEDLLRQSGLHSSSLCILGLNNHVLGVSVEGRAQKVPEIKI